MGASSESLNLAWLENLCQEPDQGLLAMVLRSINGKEASDGLKLQVIPLSRTSGTCFPSKVSICKATSSEQTPRTGLFYQICPGIEEFAV